MISKIIVATLLSLSCQSAKSMDIIESFCSSLFQTQQPHVQQKIPNEILCQTILILPLQKRIELRTLNHTFRNAIDLAHEKGDFLEELVFALIHHHNITIKFLDSSKVGEQQEGRAFCIGKGVEKLPQTREELKDWCTRGYQFKTHERANKYTTTDYSFLLFYHGIDLGVLPIVRYTLENHNNFWTRKDLRRELTFYLSRIAVSVGNVPIMEKNKSYNPNHLDTKQRNSFENTSFTLITYLILKDEISLFDYMIQHPDVRNFSFGVGSKNGMGNTPFHTLGKYGSEAMIKRFLKEDDLITLCLNVDNIQGEYGQGEENLNLVQLAQKFNRPQTVIDLLLSHPIVKERCLK